MAHITGEDRSQLLLLPDTVDDYVGPDNPVRFIDAFVDGLDLEAAGFQRVRPNDKGRPGYDPADLLKLYIYGYLNRIRSSRRLETWQAKDISRVIRTADPERHGIELSLLHHVSPIEWDNIVLYGEYVLNRRLVRRSRSWP